MKCIDGDINQIDWILIATSPPLSELKMNPHAHHVLCGGRSVHVPETTANVLRYFTSVSKKRAVYLFLLTIENVFTQLCFDHLPFFLCVYSHL